MKSGNPVLNRLHSFVILTGLCLLIPASASQAQSPKAEGGIFALTHATIVTITKGTITDGTIIMVDGKIHTVGAGLQPPSEAKVIDCTGLYVYPGMIDSGTLLGVTEIGSDPRTQDHNELGEVIPQMRALAAVNPSSVIIPVTRINGVTTVLSMPTSGLFSGTAALINLHGYTADQLAAGFEGIVMNFPVSTRRNRFDQRTEEEINKEFEKAIRQLNDVWDKVKQYHTLDSATHGQAGYYPELQALLPVYRGEMTLMIEVEAAKDIRYALKWVEEKKIKKVVLMGVAEGWRAAEAIAKAGIPVITGPMFSLPTRAYDRYDKAYANAGLMKKAGVKVAIRTKESENVRNLPYNAGFAAAYGLGKEEALRAVTIVPAEIFGVDDRLGSIEQGKNATLFVCDGDPFEPATQIKQVFIDGWKIPLESRQTLLYNEFLERQPGLEKAENK